MMRKFAVFSGFLGAGKTTTMMALTKYMTEHGTKSAMISNDLGHGVTLADDRLAKFSGCNASQMTEDCICYQNENLADRLQAQYEEGCQLVISDIPGFGVGALEHVYHGLTEKFPDRFQLAPFTVLVEPGTVEILRGGTGEDLEYIYDTQLTEADLIVLNKCDLIDEQRKRTDAAWLSEHYPQAKVIAISARSGNGLETLAQALVQGKASMRRPDIGYGGERFLQAMSRMSEYYLQYRADVCCNDFDGNAYLLELAQGIRAGMEAAGREIPHLKLLAWEPEGDFGKVDILGTEKAIEVNHRFEKPCATIAVLVNASAVCPSEELTDLISNAVNKVSDLYGLELVIHKEECFGMVG